MFFCNGCGNGKGWCNGRNEQGTGVGGFRGIVRKISLMVRIGSNPSGSRPNFFGRQHLTFDKGGKFSTGRGDGCAFEKVVEIERVDATGGASKARMP